MTGTGFPHSEILGSRFVCQLPEAYRRLPRPSSAPGAKASTLCPYKLQPQKTKMLASTVQFSNNDQAHHQHPTPTHPNHTAEAGCTGPAAPTVPHHHRTKRPGARGDPKKPVTLTAAVPSGPNSVSWRPPRPDPTPFPPRTQARDVLETEPAASRLSSTFHPEHHPTHERHGHGPWPTSTKAGRQALLRKEVIQPHLPVRLPCYDLVLIASPTFDHSPPCGLGHGLRVLPTFMT